MAAHLWNARPYAWGNYFSIVCNHYFPDRWQWNIPLVFSPNTNHNFCFAITADRIEFDHRYLLDLFRWLIPKVNVNNHCLTSYLFTSFSKRKNRVWAYVTQTLCKKRYYFDIAADRIARAVASSVLVAFMVALTAASKAIAFFCSSESVSGSL